MDYKEYAQKSREEHRKLFGEVGMKTDCIHYHHKKGEDWCIACVNDYDHNRLQCECRVCYFYQPKEENK